MCTCRAIADQLSQMGQAKKSIDQAGPDRTDQKIEWKIFKYSSSPDRHILAKIECHLTVYRTVELMQ